MQSSHIFDLPLSIKVQKGFRMERRVALCIILKCLAYPCRLKELEHFFGIHYSLVSKVFGFMVDFVVENFSHLLKEPVHWIAEDKQVHYQRKIAEVSGVDLNVVGFIDGTVRPIGRPVKFQKRVYNGHKRTHSNFNL
jgi:hypothetical protein